MKKALLFLTVLFVSAVQAQTEIPAVVKDSFTHRFPESKVLHWTFRGNLYAARFRTGHKSEYAYFDPAGHWTGTEEPLRIHMMPETLRKAFYSSRYAGWYIQEVRRVTGPDSAIYVMHVDNGPKLDGEHMFNFGEDWLLFYDTQNRLFREERKEDSIR